ncbi:MAG: hypothetical protein QOC95_495, partial [Thermoleophilaceae bacterium]|nr:hypothetical protein [Thermoleophilaceae bacterium]
MVDLTGYRIQKATAPAPKPPPPPKPKPKPKRKWLPDDYDEESREIIKAVKP